MHPKYSSTTSSPYSQYSDEGSPPISHSSVNMSNAPTANPLHHRASFSQPYNAFTPGVFASYASSPESCPGGNAGHLYAEQGSPPLYTPSLPSLSGFTEDIKPMYSDNYASQSIIQLQQHIAQLQHVILNAETEILQLRAQLQASGRPSHSGFSRSDFQADWQRRTDARVKLICASNRAGNTLCAWHDSRRERRAYPPRMAPNGILNCGCSEEEALFEESLARNGVGSYRPSGDQVRMDPQLRRPLLDLLKRRFNYRDGDFELDLINGSWQAEQDSRTWESNLRSSRRP